MFEHINEYTDYIYAMRLLHLSALLLLRALRVLRSCRLIGASSSVLGITTSVLALVMTRNYNMCYIECLYIRILERALISLCFSF